MNPTHIYPAALSALLLLATPSSLLAGEVFVGVMAHNVDLPLSKGSPEKGADVHVGLRSEPFARLGPGELRAHVFGSVNSGDGVNFAAAGLNLRFPLGAAFYVQPGFGVAVHDGSAANFPVTPDRLYLGSRVLFEPELTLGVGLSRGWAAELGWIHLSHARLSGKQNPGLDDVGVRLVHRF